MQRRKMEVREGGSKKEREGRGEKKQSQDEHKAGRKEEEGKNMMESHLRVLGLPWSCAEIKSIDCALGNLTRVQTHFLSFFCGFHNVLSVKSPSGKS